MNERATQLNSQGCKYLNEKDYVSAYKYFAEAARLGDNNAIYNVGYCYFNGYGVSKNYEKAFQFLSKFVDTKSDLSITAAYLCGVMLDDGGFGLKSDKKQAGNYYCKAAEKGHSWSLLMLGRLHQLNGDYQTAKEYIETAMKTASNDYELQQRGKKLLRLNKIARWCK